MFGRVAKIPIANTCSELVEMSFADYGDYATFCTYKILFRVFGYYFLGAKKKEEQTAEMVRESIILELISFSGHLE